MSEITVGLDPNVYRLSAVKKAAYRLGDRGFFHIELNAAGQIQVTLKAKSERVMPETLLDEFLNEVLDGFDRGMMLPQPQPVR